MQVRYPKMVELPVTTLDASVLVVKSFWEPQIGCVGGALLGKHFFMLDLFNFTSEKDLRIRQVGIESLEFWSFAKRSGKNFWSQV